MIIWGWGKVIRSYKGYVFQKQCGYCNTVSFWRLCVKRTWFTLFFIPIIPYHKTYCIECPNCGSYIEINKQQYQEIYQQMKMHDMIAEQRQNTIQREQYYESSNCN